MGKLTRLIPLFLFACALAGCLNFQQQIVSAARQPGQQVTTTPERLWKEGVCQQSGRPFVRVESLEIVPQKVKAGARVNYRIVYSMCPASKFSEILNARVDRKLFYKGQVVATNVKEDLEIRAGRWAVDSFFTLPAATPLGVYALEVAVEPSTGRTQKLSRSFVVSDEFYLSGQ
jgi:hypothetical protein